MKRTVRGTATSGPYRGNARVHDTVGEDKILHRRAGRYHIPDNKQCARREGGNVIDRHVLKQRRSGLHRHLREFAGTIVLRTVDVVDHDVMYAVALPVDRRFPIRQSVGDLHPGSYMTDDVIPDGYIRDLATGTAARIFWSQHNGETNLRESTPAVFQNISFEQNPLSIFQFEQVLDD